MSIVDRWMDTLRNVDVASDEFGATDAIATRLLSAAWTSSLVSIADDVAGGALAEALARALIPPDWAVSCASHKSEPADRVHACTQIALVAGEPHRAAALKGAISILERAPAEQQSALRAYLDEHVPEIPLPDLSDDIEDGPWQDEARKRLEFLEMFQGRRFYASHGNEKLMARLERVSARDTAQVLEAVLDFFDEGDRALKSEIRFEIVEWLEAPYRLSPGESEEIERESEARARALGKLHASLPRALLESLLLSSLSRLRSVDADLGPSFRALAPPLASVNMVLQALDRLASQETMSSQGWAAYAELVKRSSDGLQEEAWPGLMAAIDEADDIELRELIPAVAPHLPASAFQAVLERVSAIDSDTGQGKLEALLACIPHAPPALSKEFSKQAHFSALESRYTPVWRRDLLAAELAELSPNADAFATPTLYFTALRDMLERGSPHFYAGTVDIANRVLPKLSSTMVAKIMPAYFARAEEGDGIDRIEALSVSLRYLDSVEATVRAADMLSTATNGSVVPLDELDRSRLALALVRIGRCLSGSPRFEAFDEALRLGSQAKVLTKTRGQLVAAFASMLEEDAPPDAMDVLVRILDSAAELGRPSYVESLRGVRAALGRASGNHTLNGIARSLLAARRAWP
jgi:hypothetical protein